MSLKNVEPHHPDTCRKCQLGFDTMLAMTTEFHEASTYVLENDSEVADYLKLQKRRKSEFYCDICDVDCVNT